MKKYGFLVALMLLVSTLGLFVAGCGNGAGSVDKEDIKAPAPPSGAAGGATSTAVPE